MLFVGHIVALDAILAAIRMHMGGTHRTVQTPFWLTREIRSRAYTNSNVLGRADPSLLLSLSRCKPATPLSWNSGVLTMLGRARQVRSDHPWAPGSALMATPRRNCSLGEERERERENLVLFRLS